jgi:hypothetical protein
MNTNRVAVGLTVLNGILLVGLLSQISAARAETLPMLRGKGLEIVDDRGIVRAQIVVNPETTNADGRKVAGGVLLRLIDGDQKPLVKLGASIDGSGLMLSGDSGQREWHGIQILAKPAVSTLRLLNADGREHLIKP